MHGGSESDGSMSDPQTGRRWLQKALREASGELYSLLMQALRDSLDDAEALVERAWREEQITAWQLGHLLFRDIDEVPLHDFEWLEQRGLPDCHQQLHEFIQVREQISGVLSMLSDHEWQRAAPHRFRGEISVESIARRQHQTDLEILNQLRAQIEAC